ncbi:MAG: hypothetical protein PVH68_09415 [Armatimonadota bacterium]
MREATKIAKILTDLKIHDDVIVSALGEDRLIVYAPDYDTNRKVRRLIAQIDIPEPQVRLDLWGIQISGEQANAVAQTAQDIRSLVSARRHAIQEALNELRLFAAEEVKLDPDFRHALTDDKELAYKTVFDTGRPLTMVDVFLRLVAARDPTAAVQALGKTLQDFTGEQCTWLKDGKEEEARFAALLTALGAEFSGGQWTVPGSTRPRFVDEARLAILEFGLEYYNLIVSPHDFSPYGLHWTADVLDGMLSAMTQALHQDIQALYVDPLLHDIRDLAPKAAKGGISLVGKTSITCLNGVPAYVSGQAVSYFDVTPPPSITPETLTRAEQLEKAYGSYFGLATAAAGATPEGAAAMKGGSLLLAMGEQQQAWAELKAGITLEFTPYVSSNADSAELVMEVVVGTEAPTVQGGGAQTEPVSRIAQHQIGDSGKQVHTRVTALDIFPISTFSVQSSHPRPDFVFPILGRIPYIGEMFRCPRSAARRHHESIILVNSSIVTSAIDVGRLYPIRPDTADVATKKAVRWDQIQDDRMQKASELRSEYLGRAP